MGCDVVGKPADTQQLHCKSRAGDGQYPIKA
jgi:hypothetical protein